MQSLGELAQEKKSLRQDIPAVSAVFKDGGILEMVHDAEAKKTRFVLWQDGKWEFRDGVDISPVRRLVPYSAYNNLIRNDVVLFAIEPEEYESEAALLAEIQAFIHRYVDVSPLFEQIASYYVLFSWVFDGFNELPYLRVRGDPGSGKTRFLLTVGSLCYKPIFASGASTVSPIFRILEAFRGTLVIDESDFRMSDEKAELVKILNNGRSMAQSREERTEPGACIPDSRQNWRKTSNSLRGVRPATGTMVRSRGSAAATNTGLVFSMERSVNGIGTMQKSPRHASRPAAESGRRRAELPRRRRRFEGNASTAGTNKGRWTSNRRSLRMLVSLMTNLGLLIAVSP